MEIKLNDVYSFMYNSDYSKTYPNSDLYHCFDGQLIVRQRGDKLILEDTYWSSDNRIFTLEDALKQGELTFKCNLNDVEKIGKHELKYYDDNDTFNLSHQHRCYDSYVKKIGACRSKEKIESVIKDMIDNENHKIIMAGNSIKRLNEDLVRLNNGEIDTIYL